MHLVTVSVELFVALSTISHNIEILLGIARVRHVSLFAISYATHQAPRANVELPLEKIFYISKVLHNVTSQLSLGKSKLEGHMTRNNVNNHVIPDDHFRRLVEKASFKKA